MGRTSTIPFRSIAPVTDAVFRKELGCLKPADEEAEKVLRGVKLGECVTVDVKKPRNLQHHRKFWKLMETICQNQEHYATAKDICTVFKFRIGHTKKILTRDGIVEEPLSISFAAMDQDEFAAFYDRAVDFVLKEVIPGLKREDLERELMEFMQ